MKLRTFWFLLFATAACSTASPTFDAGTAPVNDAGQALAQDEDTIPCPPRSVLQSVCQQCHSNPMQNGAPFPLVNRSDILATGPGGTLVRTLMIEQLSARRMPLAPVTIEEEDRTILLDWLQQGAPGIAATKICVDEDGGVEEDAGADAQDVDAETDAGVDAESDASDASTD